MMIRKILLTREQGRVIIYMIVQIKRMYKTINLPSDFDWECYLGLNYDV